MKNSNPTKKQHFVPQFYLKNFADSEGSLQVLNLREKRMAKPRPYQGLGYEYYYYAMQTGIADNVSQQIEEWFKPLEDFISNQLPRIIKRIENCQHISDDDRYIISTFMSMLWLRTPSMRAQLNAMNENIAKQIDSMHGDDSGDKFRSKDNMDHIRFMVNSLGFGDSGFANMFFAMKWKAYLAKGNKHFVTSDSPIVEKWLPPKGFYGASFLQRDKYFALTPKILLYLTLPRGSSKFRRKTLYKEQDDIVKSMNIILVSGAQDYAYSDKKALLESLLAGRQNPGRLEKEYIEKYEIPWNEHRAKMRK